MARSISPTPVLKGKDAKRFLKKMEESPSKKEVQFLKKAKEAYGSSAIFMIINL